MVRLLLMWFATQPRMLKARPDANTLSSITPKWLGGTITWANRNPPLPQPG
jgi:hypothetical protein